MKKRIFMALLAAISCLTLASCGDEKEDDPKPAAGEVVMTTTWEDSGSSIDIILTQKSSLYTLTTTTSYAYSGNEITGMTMVEDCGTAIVAKEVYNEILADMDDDEDIQYSLNGSKISAVYGPSNYEDLTKEAVVALAKRMEGTKTISANDLSGLEF